MVGLLGERPGRGVKSGRVRTRPLLRADGARLSLALALLFLRLDRLRRFCGARLTRAGRHLTRLSLGASRTVLAILTRLALCVLTAVLAVLTRLARLARRVLTAVLAVLTRLSRRALTAVLAVLTRLSRRVLAAILAILTRLSRRVLAAVLTDTDPAVRRAAQHSTAC